MASQALRRSLRLQPYVSNGRDYLADIMCWSREKLEEWMKSATVRPHLQIWYQLCVAQPERFNHAIQWINAGGEGYFYNPNELEENLLLMCLAAGDSAGLSRPRFADARTLAKMWGDEHASTTQLPTQEIWARSVWRIVHDNRDQGQAFHSYTDHHLAACYGFAIEVLCIAFHSLAFRGRASVYEGLINGGEELKANTDSCKMHMEQKEDHDEDDDAGSSTGSSSEHSEFEAETADDSVDGDGGEWTHEFTLTTSVDERETGEVTEVERRSLV